MVATSLCGAERSRHQPGSNSSPFLPMLSTLSFHWAIRSRFGFALSLGLTGRSLSIRFLLSHRIFRVDVRATAFVTRHDPVDVV